jgi:uncharacterized protein (DUF362 family)
MKSITRRQFLHWAVRGTGALVVSQILSACSPKRSALPTQTSLPSQTPSSAPASALPPTPSTVLSPTAIPAEISNTPSSAPSAVPVLPDLVVARNGEPEDLVRKAVKAFGGIEKFVKNGAWVIIKPNICTPYHSYEYATTTNPWVVAALVKLCLEAGSARVQVMDFPFGGPAEESYTKSGIAEQVKAAGGEMAYMPAFKYKSYSIPNGKSLKQTEIFEDILKADVLINVPIAKHHSLARLTLGMKNLMGVILDRGRIHSDFAQRLADLNSFVHPTFTVVDAIRILTDHGPTGGNMQDVKKIDTIIVGQDIIAVDSYGATLFGKSADYLEYVKIGAAMGLGRMDIENLKIEEI